MEVTKLWEKLDEIKRFYEHLDWPDRDAEFALREYPALLREKTAERIENLTSEIGYELKVKSA